MHTIEKEKSGFFCTLLSKLKKEGNPLLLLLVKLSKPYQLKVHNASFFQVLSECFKFY